MLKGYKLQETLLNALCQEQVPVSVSLRNEAKLEGQIASFDQYAILLKSPAPHLVYKHAIIHLDPSRDFELPLELGPEPAPESKPKEAQQSDPKRVAVQIRKKSKAVR